MKIGVAKEIKTLEFRVGMTPAGVHEVVTDGHEVIVETGAGAGIGVTPWPTRRSVTLRRVAPSAGATRPTSAQ